MKPSLHVVQRRRQVALTIVRAAALVMIVYASFNILWGLGSGFGMSNLRVAEGIRAMLVTFWSSNWNPFWYGFALLVPGIVLIWLDRRIVRWLVPSPQHECPECGYPLRSLQARRCPECGYLLTDSSSSASVPKLPN